MISVNSGFVVKSRLDVITSVCGMNFRADFLDAMILYPASLRPEHLLTGSVYIFCLGVSSEAKVGCSPPFTSSVQKMTSNTWCINPLIPLPLEDWF